MWKKMGTTYGKLTLFQTIMQPSIDVETTKGDALAEFVCSFPPSFDSMLGGQLFIQVTQAECPEKLPINSPVLEDIAWIRDLLLQRR